MQVQLNCGDGLAAKDTLERWAAGFLDESLQRFRDELTRVEVQLTDQAKGKHNGQDIHCMLEGRLTSHAPVAVHHDAENMDEAIRGATRKLINALDHKLGKLDRHEHRSRDTIRKDPEAVEQLGGAPQR